METDRMQIINDFCNSKKSFEIANSLCKDFPLVIEDEETYQLIASTCITIDSYFCSNYAEQIQRLKLGGNPNES